MWFIGVEVEQEKSAPPPKNNPGSAPELVSQAFPYGLGAKIEERESKTARKMTLVPFLARPKPKIFPSVFLCSEACYAG